MAFLPLIGAGLSAVGSIAGGVASAQSASYQAQIASNNATAARQNAVYSAGAAASNTETAGLKARSENAGLRSGIAASGVDVNSGSASDVQQSERDVTGLDTANTAARGAETVYGYQTQATNFQAQSAMYNAEVGPDIAGGVLKGVGGLLSGSSTNGLGSLVGGSPSESSQNSWMQGSDQGSGGDAGSSDLDMDFG